MTVKKYTVTWYTNAVKIGKSVMALGLCEKTGNVSFIAAYRLNKPIGEEFLKTLILQDVYANDSCEDGRFCINVECPLNKPDYDYWKKYAVQSLQELQRLHQRMEEVKNKLDLKVTKHGQQHHFTKTPLKYKKTVRRPKIGEGH